MINRLAIAGFKRFDEEGITLPLAPITLLLGCNSSGKSSVLQSLICLAQTWKRPSGLLYFAPAGKYVDLGRFGRVLHRENGRSASELTLRLGSVTFSWEDINERHTEDGFELPSDTRHGILSSVRVERRLPPPTFQKTEQAEGQFPPAAEEPTRGEGPLPPAEDFTFAFRAVAEEAEGTTDDTRLCLTLSAETAQKWVERRPEDSSLLDPLVGQKHLASLQWIVSDDEGRLPAQCVPVEAAEALAETVTNDPRKEGSLWFEAELALDQVFRIRGLLRRMAYIGGLRERGSRIQLVHNADRPWRVGPSGRRLADVMLSIADVQSTTNELLENAGIPYQVVTRDLAGVSDAIELLLLDKRKGPTGGNEVGILDVGSGVAQLLPVLVQLAVLKSMEEVGGDALLLVEQPELHLHPKWQGRLARVFSSAILRQDSEENRVQILLETHSEHLVLGLGNEIYQGKLNKEDVLILAFEDNVKLGHTVVREIRFEEDGRFRDRWPGGFFSERRQLLQGEIP